MIETCDGTLLFNSMNPDKSTASHKLKQTCWNLLTRVNPVSAPLSSFRCKTPKSASQSGNYIFECTLLSKIKQCPGQFTGLSPNSWFSTCKRRNTYNINSSPDLPTNIRSKKDTYLRYRLEAKHDIQAESLWKNWAVNTIYVQRDHFQPSNQSDKATMMSSKLQSDAQKSCVKLERSESHSNLEVNSVIISVLCFLSCLFMWNQLET